MLPHVEGRYARPRLGEEGGITGMVGKASIKMRNKMIGEVIGRPSLAKKLAQKESDFWLSNFFYFIGELGHVSPTEKGRVYRIATARRDGSVILDSILRIAFKKACPSNPKFYDLLKSECEKCYSEQGFPLLSSSLTDIAKKILPELRKKRIERGEPLIITTKFKTVLGKSFEIGFKIDRKNWTIVRIETKK